MISTENGGVQFVPQIAVQYVYLDFDGALTSYNGEILAVDNVEVQPSKLTEERISAIVSALNEQYISQNVIFVTERPVNCEYSTVFIGKTSAFDEHGKFAGLAERIDTDNQIPNDNAFVMLDFTAADAEIISAIAHETGHILGTLDHGGGGLRAYADLPPGYIYYYYDNNNTCYDVYLYDGELLCLSKYDSGRTIVSSEYANGAEGGYVCIGSRYDHASGAFVGWFGAEMHVYSGGRANDTVLDGGSILVYSGGKIYKTRTAGAIGGGFIILSGGVADDTDVEGAFHVSVCAGGRANNTDLSGYLYFYMSRIAELVVFSAGVANNTTVNRLGRVYVSNGGVANSTTINSGGDMIIYSGGVANSTTINSGGGMIIYSGGVADNTTVDSRGDMYICSGGVADNTTVNSGGGMGIADGGVANSTTINSGGDMIIYSGGVADNTTVNAGGSLTISSGGSAFEIIENGGYVFAGARAEVTFVSHTVSGLSISSLMTVHQNTIADNTTVNSGGSIIVYSGGVADSTTVNAGGSLTISSGGSAFEIIENGGYVSAGAGAEVTFASHTVSGLSISSLMTVHQNTIADSTTINSLGGMHILSGGIAHSTTVNAGGSLKISSGGKAVEIIENGGWISVGIGAEVTYASHTVSGLSISRLMTVHQNTIADNTTVDSGGSMYIYSGGIAHSTTIINWGAMFIDGIAHSTTINSGGGMYISRGGIAHSTTINSGGGMYISRGGVANSTTINSSGSMYIFSGGVGSCTTVNTGGYLKISSGGSAVDIIENGGFVSVGAGTEVTFASHTVSGLSISSGMTVHQNTVADSTVIDGNGSMCIFRGGIADNTTVNAGGSMYVSSGSANRTTVNAGGYLGVSFGGTAVEIIENGGCVSAYYGAEVAFGSNTVTGLVLSNWMTVHQNTVANSTTVNAGGRVEIFSGGVADSMTVNSGGSLTIASGGTATNVVWTPCIGRVSAETGADVTYTSTYSGVYFGSANQLLSSAQTMTDGVLAKHSMYVMSDGFADNTTVNSGSIYISSGGCADSTTINSGGGMDIFAGGSADNTTVNSGKIYIFSGGAASSTILNSKGSMYICSGGSADNTTVNSGGYISISSGVASSTTLGYRGSMYIYSGGSADNTTVNSGELCISSGGFADNTTVNSGWMGISRDGVVNRTVVNSGGDMTTYAGGVAGNTVVNDGGYLTIASGGTASEIVENGGRVWVDYGAQVTFASHTVSGLSISSFMTVHQNTVADSTTVNAGELRIYSGGIANDTTVSGGTMDIISGGVAVSTMVNSGRMNVSSGGFARNTTVNAGNMYIKDGGVHEGYLQIASGAKVIVDRSARIDFTLTDRTVENDCLINDLSLLSGTPTYTITVSASQKSGRYALAAGAGGFTGSISVGDGSVQYGRISVGGEKLEFNGKSYSLDLVDGLLSLSVSGEPVLSGDKNGVSFINMPDTWNVVEFSKDGFDTRLQMVVGTSAVDLLNTPAGTYQWQVWESTGYIGEDIVSDNTTEPQVLISDADGNADIFFADVCGTWSANYMAVHQGELFAFADNPETALIEGKNRLNDVFIGSSDANVLILTDDDNGDALFLDDIYTALGDQARLAQIQEIRAGGGDDIIDLTSTQFAYENSPMSIYGGAGNDIIWAADGMNFLIGGEGEDRIVGGRLDDVIIGGSGNDRLHGGGGQDVFYFNGSWGEDIVEQTDDGIVILRFGEGSMDNWDVDTKTYFDENLGTVKVYGGADVILEFGCFEPVPGDGLGLADKNRIWE